MFTKIVNENPRIDLGNYNTEAGVRAINPQLLTDFDKWVKSLVGKLRNADNNGSAKKVIEKFETAITNANFVETVKKCQNGQATVDDVNKSVQAVYVAYGQLKTDCDGLDKSQKKPVDPPKDDKNGQGSAGSSKRPKKDGEDEKTKKYIIGGLVLLALAILLAFLLVKTSGCSKTAESAKKATVVNADSVANAKTIDSLKAVTDSLRAVNDRLNEPPEWFKIQDKEAAKLAAEGEEK